MEHNEKQLEELLVKASLEPNQRPVFLEQLLNADIYCIGFADRPVQQGGERVLEEGSQVRLMHLQDEKGEPYLPFFLSLESLQKGIQEEQSYLRIPARSFFEMTLGASLVLNPFSEYGKEFVPQEIEALLQGGYGSKLESYEYQEQTEVLLGQPAEYPHEMVDQLCILLKTKPEVKNAYLAQMHDQKRDPEPTLLIGFETDQALDHESFQRLKNQIGHVAYDSLVRKRMVDLIHLDNADATSALQHYLREETEAFYVRIDAKKKGFFARLFS
ncbi:enhanced serine sensitivity protein SseB C-terminal domain-containing protein [Acinetobacter sp. ANC 7454]|uniref:enhanced serine sensitivity protein SseB C-terminal domain-containing protein n=1 Tax=Acinetobacter thermotolerans TaxID=3151487 RepID=UPI00325BB5A7